MLVARLLYEKRRPDDAHYIPVVLRTGRPSRTGQNALVAHRDYCAEKPAALSQEPAHKAETVGRHRGRWLRASRRGLSVSELAVVSALCRAAISAWSGST